MVFSSDYCLVKRCSIPKIQKIQHCRCYTAEKPNSDSNDSVIFKLSTGCPHVKISAKAWFFPA